MRWDNFKPSKHMVVCINNRRFIYPKKFSCTYSVICHRCVNIFYQIFNPNQSCLFIYKLIMLTYGYATGYQLN